MRIFLLHQNLSLFTVTFGEKVLTLAKSRALKSRSKLRAAIGLRAALRNFLLNQNSSLFTVTFGEKVLTLAKNRGS